jgi:hypothetical protein
MEERMREVAVAEEKRRTMEWMGGTEGEEVGEEPISKDHPPDGRQHQGEPLCQESRIQGYPTLKWGDTSHLENTTTADARTRI